MRKLGKDEVLILRTCNADGTSHGGFQWPKKGKVEAPDWKDNYQCGGGLHGLLWGVGSEQYLDLNSPVWVVFRAKLADVRTGKGDLTDKCKARRGVVVFYGPRDRAIAFLSKYAPSADGVFRSASQTGDMGSATQTGDMGSASQTGDRGSATQTGYRGSATQTGDRGSASCGTHSVAAAFFNGEKVKCQKFGCIILGYWDGERFRQVVGYEGENGIKADTWYTLDEAHKLVEWRGTEASK